MASSGLPPIIQASAGAVGSLISNAAIYPLDTLATRLQTASSGKKAAKDASRVNALMATVRRMYQERGLSSFYRGVASDSVSTVLSNFLYFYCYIFLRNSLIKRKPTPPSTTSKGGKAAPPPILSAVEELVVGMLAGCVAKGVVSPLSNITVRAQTAVAAKKKDDEQSKAATTKAVVEAEDSSSDEDDNEFASPSIAQIAKEIYREKGWAGFWSGYSSTIFLTMNPAISFYLLQLFQRTLLPARHRERPTPVQTFLTSAFASAFATTFVYPLILAKARLQFKSPSGRRVYRSNLDVIRKTIRRRGIQGMYAGLEAQVVKVFFSEGIKLLVKERLELLVILAYRSASSRKLEA